MDPTLEPFSYNDGGEYRRLGDSADMRPRDPNPKTLASCKVLDRQGREIVLGSLWAEGPTLLVFLRYFGCLCCSEQITELAPRLEELHQLGIRTVLVGE